MNCHLHTDHFVSLLYAKGKCSKSPPLLTCVASDLFTRLGCVVVHALLMKMQVKHIAAYLDGWYWWED